MNYKGFMIFFAVVLTVSTIFIDESNGIILNINETEINEAIKLGEKNKRTLLGEFTKDWTVSLGKKVGWATLYTGFHNLAFKSRKASIENKELTKKEINKALEISQDLTFTVSILGNSMGFAREYHGMLKIGKDLIAPSFEFIPETTESSEFWPDSPDSIAGCVFKFPMDDIDEDSKVVLILQPFDGEVLQFNFDLSAMK